MWVNKDEKAGLFINEKTGKVTGNEGNPGLKVIIDEKKGRKIIEGKDPDEKELEVVI